MSPKEQPTMASVTCEIVFDDPDYKTVAVPARDRKEFLQVPAGFVRTQQGKHYLSVNFVQRDRARGDILVQLPVEADSGANRIWVSKDNYQEQEAGGVAV
jgi:hypothetical protein